MPNSSSRSIHHHLLFISCVRRFSLFFFVSPYFVRWPIILALKHSGCVEKHARGWLRQAHTQVQMKLLFNWCVIYAKNMDIFIDNKPTRKWKKWNEMQRLRCDCRPQPNPYTLLVRYSTVYITPNFIILWLITGKMHVIDVVHSMYFSQLFERRPQQHTTHTQTILKWMNERTIKTAHNVYTKNNAVQYTVYCIQYECEQQTATQFKMNNDMAEECRKVKKRSSRLVTDNIAA